MSEKAERIKIACDSCFFISVFKRETDREKICLEIINDAKDGLIDLFISMLVIAECRTPSGSKDVLPFFQQDFLVRTNVDFYVAKQAKELMESDPGLKGADAVHLSTALLNECQAFFTFDEGLIKKSGFERLKNLKICAPSRFWSQQPTLPGTE